MRKCQHWYQSCSSKVYDMVSSSPQVLYICLRLYLLIMSDIHGASKCIKYSTLSCCSSVAHNLFTCIETQHQYPPMHMLKSSMGKQYYNNSKTILRHKSITTRRNKEINSSNSSETWWEYAGLAISNKTRSYNYALWIIGWLQSILHVKLLFPLK